MAHCINANCPNPENPPGTTQCQACGSSLLLNGRYEIIHALGQGGFGATFLSRNRSLPGNPYCVIKQLRPNSTAANVLKMARDLFHREAKTLGKIGNNPQIPMLLDYFEDRNEFFLVQEFIRGLTLHQEVKRGGPFTEAGVRQVLSEILPVLSFIHSQEVIHRDIKPANIIRRSQDKKLVLIDFGAVKDKVSPVSAASEHTALTSYAIGTPGYAPPEQMAMRPVFSSDIYALGVTCLYLLTGKSPKDLNYNPATGEMMWHHFVDITPSFEELLKKMLEVSVKHRYQSAEEVLQAMQMEPYIDSLSQGMMSQRPPRPGEPSTEAPNTGGHVSPYAREAEAIRAKRARRSGTPGAVAATGRSDATQVRTSGHRRPNGPVTAVTASGGNPNSGGGMSNPLASLRLHPLELQKRYDRGDRDFTTTDLRKLNLQRLVLSGANFHEARLQGSNLQGADLSHTDLGHASLTQARLREANLTKAYMSHADLQEADLRGADLTNAYLSNANLRGANLCGANLSGAKVTDEQLALAKLNWNTVFPNGRRGGLW